MAFTAAATRVTINPPPGVELTGWGYYLARCWQDVLDDIHATALVLDDGHHPLAIISLDMMVISRDFTRSVREQIAAATDLAPDSILVSCTHTHNGPASGGLLGVGQVDPDYEAFAARQAAATTIDAWNRRVPATAHVAATNRSDLTFNRTRDNGPVDPTLTTLRLDDAAGNPLAIVVNFQAHPTVLTKLHPYSVSRDTPGLIADRLEQRYPGIIPLYLQGACGDVNFHRHFVSPDRCHEPARELAGSIIGMQESANRLDNTSLATAVGTARLPTRRWTDDEIESDRSEALHRLEHHDITGWRDTIGRVMTNNPDDMIRRHGGDEWKAVAAMCRFNIEWTDRMIPLLDQPEWLDVDVQAMRIGDLGIVANGSEFFTTLALDIRERADVPHLMISAYSNERIGYLPDAHDVQARTYAAWQSPKYCIQFPFTEQSGPAMCDAMLKTLTTLD
ncbi:MAG: hypothetical protein ACF8PG_07505 [Maioricimonas sp. JB045]